MATLLDLIEIENARYEHRIFVGRMGRKIRLVGPRYARDYYAVPAIELRRPKG